MPLTPTDVINVAFSKPPLGKRGYSGDEVDAFLDLVESELTRLIKENTALRKQIDLHERVAAADAKRNPHPLAPPQPVKIPIPPTTTEQTLPGDDHHVQAAKMLSLAQQTADRLTGEAKSAADGMVIEARAKSEQLLSDAQIRADGMINQALTQAQTILDDVQARTETLDRQSHEKAESLEQEAVRKHTETIGPISQEKEILEKKINELRTFERELHTRLRTYLESQLRELL